MFLRQREKQKTPSFWSSFRQYPRNSSFRFRIRLTKRNREISAFCKSRRSNSGRTLPQTELWPHFRLSGVVQPAVVDLAKVYVYTYAHIHAMRMCVPREMKELVDWDRGHPRPFVDAFPIGYGSLPFLSNFWLRSFRRVYTRSRYSLSSLSLRRHFAATIYNF